MTDVAPQPTAELLAGVKRRRIQLPERGVELALLDWGGDGPLALLHHANGFCAATWGLLAKGLRSHYRVVAMDARGHGDSSSPPPGDAYVWIEFVHDLVSLVERLVAEEGGEPVSFAMGNSFGGLVSAYAAALRPELFRRVAMLDPVILPPPWLLEELAARMPGAGPDAFTSRGNPLAAMARARKQIWPSREVAKNAWAGKEMFENWAPEALELYVQEGLADRSDGQVELKCRAEVEASVFDSAGILDLFQVADRIAAPTLLLRAGRGRFPISVFQALAARMRDAQVLELDADHLMPMHNPPELAEVLLEFARDAPED